MRKSLIYVICFVLMFTLGSTASAQAAKEKAKWTKSEVLVDGAYVHMTGFNIDGSNYFKLRDVAVHLAGTSGEFDVTWNNNAKAIEIKKGKTYFGEPADDYYQYYASTQNAVLSQSKIMVDGQLKVAKIYNIDNSNYFQLRDLASLVGFDVEFASDLNQIQITSRSPMNAYKAAASKDLLANKTSQYFSRWKDTVDSYLYVNNDQTISTLEAVDNINISTYDKNYKMISSYSVEYELPIFGAFYSGMEHNYIAFGQINTEEKDNKEVIRIVKYDKQFNRLSSTSVSGGAVSTVIPFDAAAGRISEHEDTLVFHTSRERYTTEDGLNHQSQLTLIVDTKTMQVVNDTGEFQANHVSHSFDQYVLFDGNQHVLLDHGDAYPRSIVLSKGDGSNYETRDIVEIPGAIGANATGVSIGGFEMSSSSYLVAYNTIDHSKAKRYTSYEIEGIDIDQRNVMVSLVPRADVANGKIKHVTLGSYVGSNQLASIPQLVKISENKFMVLWQEFEGLKESEYDSNIENGILKYVYIDDEGNTLGNVQSIKYFNQSKVQPIVHQNNVIWYTNINNQRTFYTIPVQ